MSSSNSIGRVSRAKASGEPSSTAGGCSHKRSWATPSTTSSSARATSDPSGSRRVEPALGPVLEEDGAPRRLPVATACEVEATLPAAAREEATYPFLELRTVRADV